MMICFSPGNTLNVLEKASKLTFKVLLNLTRLLSVAEERIVPLSALNHQIDAKTQFKNISYIFELTFGMYLD